MSRVPRAPRPADRVPLTRPRRPSALRPGARPAGPGRRVPSIRRASAGLNPTRAGAVLAFLVACAGLYGATSSDAFAVRTVDVEGVAWMADPDVRAAAAIDPDGNVFTLATAPIRERIEALPPVLRADVSVSLPGTVTVTVREREPLLVWAPGNRRFLVDAEGLLFLELGAGSPAAAAELPVLVDARATSGTMRVGTVLDRVDLDASLRLGSLRPADLGSAAPGVW